MPASQVNCAGSFQGPALGQAGAEMHALLASEAVGTVAAVLRGQKVRI